MNSTIGSMIAVAFVLQPVLVYSADCAILGGGKSITMRSQADSRKVWQFMESLGARLRVDSRIYLVGGTTAVLHGWRATTIDVDLAPEPDSDGFFEAVAELKESLGLNVELANPAHFLPELPGWRDRSQWIATFGKINFYHYDYYSQVLAKIERGHPRDLMDVAAFLSRELVQPERLRELFCEIEPQMIRFPAVDSTSLRNKVHSWPAPFEGEAT